MKRFKRLLRLIVFIVLIILATLGVGIAGGVPLPNVNKREHSNEVKIELVESKEEDMEVAETDNLN